MKYLISACLLGENCKYNGGNNRNEALIRYLQGHTYVGVCPEVMGGLPIPRACSEIKDGRVINALNQDVSDAFNKGAQEALQVALQEQIDFAVLQPRSPSCGVGRIYSGDFDATLVAGNGIFAKLLQQHGISAQDVESFLAEIETKERV